MRGRKGWVVAEEEDTDTEESKMEIGDKRRSIGEGQAETHCHLGSQTK